LGTTWGHGVFVFVSQCVVVSRRKSIDSNQSQAFKPILDFYMVSWSLETYINRQNAAGGRVRVNDTIVFSTFLSRLVPAE